jgi:glycosyltransferase involved in cell wall biosynthesis
MIFPDTVAQPPIEPVAADVFRPFWSVMIPTYKRLTYLGRALQSVLDAGEGDQRMQIEVVDNCTPGPDMEALVRSVGGGRVKFHRNARNLGMAANWNACARRATGHWVHILHDDDMVMPGFYPACARLIERYPTVSMVNGPAIVADARDRAIGTTSVMAEEEGLVPDFARRMATTNHVSPPSVVIPRRVYEELGGYREDLQFAPDWEMFFRVGAAGAVVTTALPHSVYRRHAENESSVLAAAGVNITEFMPLVDLLCNRLPASERERIWPRRYDGVAMAAGYFAGELARLGHWRLSLGQRLWAVRLRPSPINLLSFAIAILRGSPRLGRLRGAD